MLSLLYTYIAHYIIRIMSRRSDSATDLVREVLDDQHAHQGSARQAAVGGRTVNQLERIFVERDDDRLFTLALARFRFGHGFSIGLSMVRALDERQRIGLGGIVLISLRPLCDCHSTSLRYRLDAVEHGLDQCVHFGVGLGIEALQFAHTTTFGGGIGKGLAPADRRVEVGNDLVAAQSFGGGGIVPSLRIGKVQDRKGAEMVVVTSSLSNQGADLVEGPDIKRPRLERYDCHIGHRQSGTKTGGITPAGINNDISVLGCQLENLSPHGGTGESDGSVPRAADLLRAQGSEITGCGLLVSIDEEHVATAAGSLNRQVDGNG